MSGIIDSDTHISEGEAMWADFLQRAAALQVRIIGWNAPRPGFQPRPDPNEVPHVRR